ncbi:MAG: UvsW-1 domain-containing protein [Culicoidibacterales bacterium]
MKTLSAFMESKGFPPKKEKEVEKDAKPVEKDTKTDDVEAGEKLPEATKYAAIGSFLDKVGNCQTLNGLDEFEAFYLKRRKEVSLLPSDDIQIRDAIAGRREQLEIADEDGEAPETQEEF